MANPSSAYLKYDEMVSFLRSWEERRPDLMELVSAGKSYANRDIWVAIITNKSTGNHSLKPAIYIDGNHHAGEVTGSAVCLYTVDYLLKNHGIDPEITRLLDFASFYIVPRVSPDGAELYLSTPYMLRSSVRPYPDEDPGEGLIPEDVDGDGLILQMRWVDPAGQWKVSDKDPRAMIPRKPGETGGTYYRMCTEGYFKHFDGVELKQARPRWGLDLNRNYPGNWHPSSQQTGPGPFPLSEPETRAVADFFRDHPNIAIALSYHTSGGYILRPRTAGPDRDMNQADLSLLKAMGRQGTSITGYTCVSIFEGFTVDQKRPSTGSFLDFAYDVLGIMSFAVELWDLNDRAGIPKRDIKQRVSLSEEQQEEDELKLLAYVDKELAGEGFYAWKQVNHRQLGEVEIGGFDPKFLRQNPPPKLLEQECHKNTLFSLMLAKCLPTLGIYDVRCRSLSDHQFEFTCSLKNTGYLPTSSSFQAESLKAVQPIKIKVTCHPEVRLLAGKEYEELQHIPGWGSSQGPLGIERKLHLIFETGPSWDKEKGELAELSIESQRAGLIKLEIRKPKDEG